MQISVTCSCTREMAPRAIPKGSFRCGCGAGVRVAIHLPERTLCAVPACGRVAERTEVVALCGGHVKDMMLALLADTYATYAPNNWIKAAGEYGRRFGAEPDKPEWLARMEAAPAAEPADSQSRVHDPVVYFAMVGDQVKIGTTTNLIHRFAAMNLPPTLKVWVIPGSYSVEQRYHRLFEAERTPRTEWFSLTPRLKQYIDDLVQKGEAACPSSVTPQWRTS